MSEDSTRVAEDGDISRTARRPENPRNFRESHESLGSRGSHGSRGPRESRGPHGTHQQAPRKFTSRTFFVNLVVLLCCIAVGWMFAANVRTNGSARSSSNTIGLLQGREADIARLQGQVDKLGRQLDSLRKTVNAQPAEQPKSSSGQAQPQQPQSSQGQSQDQGQGQPANTATDARTGELPAYRGPGVTVTLSDSPMWENAQREGTTLADTNVNDYVVHQQDLEGVVNALWAGGAEAMTIQGRRVQPTTAVRCVGNVLLLQGRQYAPPYVISAIGPTQFMVDALDASPAVTVYRQYVDAIGLGFKLERSRQLTFPATTSALRSLKYAHRLSGSSGGRN